VDFKGGRVPEDLWFLLGRQPPCPLDAQDAQIQGASKTACVAFLFHPDRRVLRPERPIDSKRVEKFRGKAQSGKAMTTKEIIRDFISNDLLQGAQDSS
jgi:hypothetical protein